MRLLLPTNREDVSEETLRELYAYPDGRPWLRANMVSSVDGAAAVAGRSEGLSSPADKRVFGLLRGLCDVVLIGAGTARAEGYRALRPKPAYAELRRSLGQRPAPALALVSGRLDLDPASELFAGTERTVVVTSAASDPAARDRLAEVADVVVAGEETVDLAAAVRALTDRGLPRVLCEGGPGLLADVAAAGVLDELCLTVTPLLAVGDARRITSGPDSDPRPLRLASVLAEDDVLLLRYLA
jgi:riboflavin biosynthesis pyrimidine reductase